MASEKRWIHVVDYLSAKLAASGVIAILFIFIGFGFDLYKWSEYVREPFFWAIFYGYAIIFSMIVDASVSRLTYSNRILASLLLYVIGGFAPFIIMFKSAVWAVCIAGVIGTLCAFTFYAVYYSMRRARPYTSVIAGLLLLLFILLATIDFSVKKQWTEARSETSYEASFTVFHGEHKIPIRLEKGQTLTFQVNWNNQNSGGYGMSVVDRKGEYVGLQRDASVKGEKYSFTAARTDVYNIKLSGNHLDGGVKVKWEVDSPS
ncbi:hypothetical protein FHS15_004069 [Paenibacillus castaneae]|uniref:hypothetical protein n=1 Tax=Paenibacillus castaneae TaxID=474957 RepID=UPI000C9C82FF|nr:hypothetical protein [Paenibacillus castaneae]NIK78923.1 hypothetical protein [Paenibacillus castaneae]